MVILQLDTDRLRAVLWLDHLMKQVMMRSIKSRRGLTKGKVFKTKEQDFSGSIQPMNVSLFMRQ